MTFNENRRLAIRREIEYLQKTRDSMSSVLEAVQVVKEFVELKQSQIDLSVKRLASIVAEDADVDAKVANLDEALGLRRQEKPIADMTMDELARHFGGA